MLVNVQMPTNKNHLKNVTTVERSDTFQKIVNQIQIALTLTRVLVIDADEAATFLGIVGVKLRIPLELDVIDAVKVDILHASVKMNRRDVMIVGNLVI